MLAVSNSLNLFQNIEWELPYLPIPMGIMMGTNTEEQQNLENFNIYDSFGVDFLPSGGYPLLQDYDIDGGLGQSPPSSGAGSGHDDHDRDHQQSPDDVLTKKRRNHNESERDRRKKINGLYSSLRALLPASDHTKKLSIPSTIGRVLKYIPDLQNEVEDLTHKKEELLSKTSALQGDHNQNQAKSLITSQEEIKPRKKPRIIKEMIKPSSMVGSISIDKLEERETVIHISTSQRMTSLPEVILHLEKAGFLVIDVSCFQSFGGRSLYNLHLEGANVVNCETLKQELYLII